ncbi:MAG: lipid deacylase LpxR family protein [Gemmatimonadetes bacterium]|nr:lipid deacylase LpxR family protein [Gemmatimonadota bacterium]
MIRLAGKWAALILAFGVALPAQTAVRVRADNDAFNFWKAPYDRPDEEYSSGVRLAFDYDGPVTWMKQYHLCDPRGEVCIQQHTRTVGQDIYTAARHIGDPIAQPGARPDAGILWVQESERDARPYRLDEASITLGVTGKPSLAEPLQKFFHGLSPRFQRPVDWSRQIPFEPAFGASYDRHALTEYHGVQLMPHGGGALGSLLTEVRGGAGVRGGWNLAHPWMPTEVSSRVELAFFGDVTLRGVIRDETLTGDLFRRSERVALKPLVTEGLIGLSVRHGRALMSYVAHSNSPEYKTRVGSHEWSTIQIEWRLQ